jgi:ABC-type hemin transport system ATPase subunit
MVQRWVKRFLPSPGIMLSQGDSVGLAAAYPDRLLVMKRGLVEAEGPHRSVLITEMIA